MSDSDGPVVLKYRGAEVSESQLASVPDNAELTVVTPSPSSGRDAREAARVQAGKEALAKEVTELGMFSQAEITRGVQHVSTVEEFLEWLRFRFHFFNIIDYERVDLVIRFFLSDLVSEFLKESYKRCTFMFRIPPRVFGTFS